MAWAGCGHQGCPYDKGKSAPDADTGAAQVNTKAGCGGAATGRGRPERPRPPPTGTEACDTSSPRHTRRTQPARPPITLLAVGLGDRTRLPWSRPPWQTPTAQVSQSHLRSYVAHARQHHRTVKDVHLPLSPVGRRRSPDRSGHDLWGKGQRSPLPSTWASPKPSAGHTWSPGLEGTATCRQGQHARVARAFTWLCAPAAT